MKKAAGAVLEIIKGILFVGFGIQIILGMVWMCFNFTRLQEFSVSGGPLYQGIRTLTGNAFVFLYGIQLVLAGAVGYLFIGRCHGGSRFFRAWGSLCLLTLPMAMQCHLAVSPYSLGCSLFLLELFFAVGVLQEKGSVLSEVAKECACWMALTLILPEYLLLGLLPILLTVLLKLPALLKNLRYLGRIVLLATAFGGMIAGIQEFSGMEERLFSRVNIAFCLFSRTGWPTIWNDASVFWTDDEIPGVSVRMLQDMSNRAEDFRRILKPLAEEAFTEDEAAAFFLKKASAGWILRPRQVIKQCGWDALCYEFSPICLPVQLTGWGGASYSGRNYELMLQRTPRLTGAYMRYGCWWFTAALPLSILAALAARLAALRNASGTERLKIWSLCMLSAAALAVGYTMRGAGMMDYKCTIATVLLWVVWMQGQMRKDD